MAGLASTAIRLLQKFGEPVTFTVSGADIDGPTGGVTPGAATTVEGHGYPSQYRQNEIDGRSVLDGDVRLIVHKLTQRPAVGWRVTVDAITYRVVTAKPIRRAGSDIIYICNIRRA